MASRLPCRQFLPLNRADSALFPSKFVITHWGTCGNVCDGLGHAVCLTQKENLSLKELLVLWLACSHPTNWFPSLLKDCRVCIEVLFKLKYFK